MFLSPTYPESLLTEPLPSGLTSGGPTLRRRNPRLWKPPLPFLFFYFGVPMGVGTFWAWGRFLPGRWGWSQAWDGAGRGAQGLCQLIPAGQPPCSSSPGRTNHRGQGHLGEPERVQGVRGCHAGGAHRVPDVCTILM